jgi:hypothetical protein
MLQRGYALSKEGNMPEEPKDKEDEHTLEEDTAPDPAAEAPPETPESQADKGDLGAKIKRLALCAEEMGLHVELTDDICKLVDNLLVAFETQKKTKALDEPDPAAATGDNNMPPAPEANYTALSQAHKKLQSDYTALQGKVTVLEKRDSINMSRLAQGETEKLVGQIKRLEQAKLVTAEQSAKWIAHLTSHQLSLVDEADAQRRETEKIQNKVEALNDVMAAQIQAGLIKGLTDDRLDMSRYAPAPGRTEAHGTADPAKEQAAQEAAGDAMAKFFKKTKTPAGAAAAAKRI